MCDSEIYVFRVHKKVRECEPPFSETCNPNMIHIVVALCVVAFGEGYSAFGLQLQVQVKIQRNISVM